MQTSKFARFINGGSWMYLVIFLTFIIGMGLAGMLVTLFSEGPEAALNFIWQLIQFDFVLAALMFNVKASLLTKAQKSVLPYMITGFMLSGIFFIVGYGFFELGARTSHEWINIIGMVFMFTALLSQSLGLAIMLMESLSRIASGFSSE